MAFWSINPNIADGYYSGECEDAKRECRQSSRVGHFHRFYLIAEENIFSSVKFADYKKEADPTPARELEKKFRYKIFFSCEAKFRLIILAENPPEEMLEQKKFGTPGPLTIQIITTN